MNIDLTQWLEISETAPTPPTPTISHLLVPRNVVGPPVWSRNRNRGPFKRPRGGGGGCGRATRWKKRQLDPSFPSTTWQLLPPHGSWWGGGARGGGFLWLQKRLLVAVSWQGAEHPPGVGVHSASRKSPDHNPKRRKRHAEGSGRNNPQHCERLRNLKKIGIEEKHKQKSGEIFNLAI